MQKKKRNINTKSIGAVFRVGRISAVLTNVNKKMNYITYKKPDQQ